MWRSMGQFVQRVKDCLSYDAPYAKNQTAVELSASSLESPNQYMRPIWALLG